MTFAETIKKAVVNLPIQQKASFAYVFGNVVSKGIAIITLPLFLSLLTTEDMGVNSVYSSWYIIFHSVMTLALTSGSVNVAMKDYPNTRKEYLSSTLTLSSVISLFFFFVVFLFKRQLSTITTLSPLLVMFMALSIIINPALELWYVRQRYEYKYKSSIIVSISLTILTTFGSLVSVFYFKKAGFENLGTIKVLASGSITTLVSLVFFFLILKAGKVFINISMWKYALTVSLPLVIHLLGKNILDISDKLMISYYCGKSDAGIYGTIYSLSSIPHILWVAINTAIVPDVFASINRKDYKKISKSTLRILVFFGLIAITFSLLAPEVLKVFTTKDYYEGVTIVPAIVSGIYFTVLYGIYGNFLLYNKKTISIMIGTVSAALINIITNYVFIRRFGYLAASYTTLLSFAFLAVFQGFLSYYTNHENYVNPTAVLVLSVIIVVICMSSMFLYKLSFIRYLIVAFLIVIIVFFVLIYIKRKEMQ